MILLLCAFFISGCAHSKQRSEDGVSGRLLIHSNLIDPDTETVFKGWVMVEHDHVVRVGHGEIPPDFQGKVFEYPNQFLIPAFADLHLHSWGSASPDGDHSEILGPEKASQLYLQAGVTTMLDLAGNEDVLFAFRKKQRLEANQNSAQAGADFFAAGAIFTYGSSNQAHPGFRPIRNPKQASAQVRDYIEQYHPDVIKIITGEDEAWLKRLSFETIKAAVDAAHALHTKVVVHIGTWKNAEQVIKAGADVVTHLDDDQKIPNRVAKLYVSHHTISIPTMSVQFDLLQIKRHPEILNDPLLKKLAAPSLLESYRHEDQYNPRSMKWLKWQADDEENDLYSLKNLASRGVPILTGSDSGNVGTFHGFSEHREMELLVRAGFPIWKTLRAATTAAHRFVGKNVCLAEGCMADFVVLEKNPVDQIQNTKTILRVMIHGRWAAF